MSHTSHEFAISLEDYSMAASVRREGEYIILNLEMPSGEERERKIPFRRYFLSREEHNTLYG